MIMKTNCRIEYSQDYLQSRDMTLIFEEMFVTTQNVDGEPEENCVRERICGFYHGEPDEELMKQYMFDGCEAVMSDEIFESMEKDTMTEWLKNNGITDSKGRNKHGKDFTYSVVVYGGFDQVPLIAYQRDYNKQSQAEETYHELEDTLRLEHKIFDNNNEVFIPQNDCSSMAIIRSGAFDDERVVYFKSLIDNTNYEDYAEDCNLIIKYFQEHNMMS